MNKIAGCARLIRNLVAISIFLMTIGSKEALYSMGTLKMSITGFKDTFLIDKDGNRYSIRKMLDSTLWMTANLKLNIPGSYCYDNSESNCDQFGRLYTWEAAERGCRLLGDGWRLPSIDEWRLLAGHYGGYPEDSGESRKKAYKALLYGGSAEFNALLGGGREADGKYARLNAHGFYWTATENDSSTAGFGNFGKGSQSLYLQKELEKLSAVSVRCVKKMDGAK